ncbi:DUF4377 domain-containing protein [Aureitalea marina]|uniref:DUF4377 domain-containing protein n=1 Tax=Aureitalea marina TaxID=930804 RepID=A0A2S7KMJ8_9FLAO|nr:DUF4377 domain-containing protein [Aureitalea marina]PQB03856.1 hypothetical protein BST85_02255 [Aureitalea marina]
MKKLVLLFGLIIFASCSSDDGDFIQEEIQLFVQHYKTTAAFSLNNVLLVQEQENIGSDLYLSTYDIQGFNFRPGYTSLLTVTKTTIRNPETDYATVDYRLISVDEQKEVLPGTTFSVPLARYANFGGYSTWLTGTEEFGYYISFEIPIDCYLNCGELNAVIPNQEEATGVFVHGPEGSYILTEIY